MEKETLSISERIRHLEEQGVLAPLEQKSKRSIPIPIPLSSELAQKLLQEDRNHARLSEKRDLLGHLGDSIVTFHRQAQCQGKGLGQQKQFAFDFHPCIS